MDEMLARGIESISRDKPPVTEEAKGQALVDRDDDVLSFELGGDDVYNSPLHKDRSSYKVDQLSSLPKLT